MKLKDMLIEKLLKEADFSKYTHIDPKDPRAQQFFKSTGDPYGKGSFSISGEKLQNLDLSKIKPVDTTKVPIDRVRDAFLYTVSYLVSLPEKDYDAIINRIDQTRRTVQAELQKQPSTPPGEKTTTGTPSGKLSGPSTVVGTPGGRKR